MQRLGQAANADAILGELTRRRSRGGAVRLQMQLAGRVSLRRPVWTDEARHSVSMAHVPSSATEPLHRLRNRDTRSAISGRVLGVLMLGGRLLRE